MSARAAVGNRASMTPKPGSLLCQSDTGILGPSEEGGSRGGTEEGGTDTGGRKGAQSRANVGRARFLRSLLIKKMTVWLFQCFFWRGGELNLAPGKVVFTAVQQSSVTVVEPAAPATHLTYE